MMMPTYQVDERQLMMKIIIEIDIDITMIIMIHSSFPNFLELALFYLMVLTYFCMFWIWPSKHLLLAIDQVIIIITIILTTTTISHHHHLDNSGHHHHQRHH